MQVARPRSPPRNSDHNELLQKWWPLLVLFSIAIGWMGGTAWSEAEVSSPLLMSAAGRRRRATAFEQEEDEQQQYSHNNKAGGMEAVLKRGFQFARSPTEYILEAAYARAAHNASALLYTEDELTMILRSLNTMRGFMNQGLWSGTHASEHFLGTGSCLIKLKQPAKQVAVGSMHGVYLQRWQKHAYRPKEETCDKRYRLRTVLGSELETALWLDTCLFGNGPYSTCTSTYIELWERNKTNPTPRLSKFLEEVPFYMLYCDEIEEAMAGEAILSGHWKRRDHKFFSDVVKIANLLDEPELAEWTRDAEEMSLAMMDPNQAYIHYKELTPPDHDTLYKTAKLNADAEPLDLGRWPEMVRVTRREQHLVEPYNRPNLLAPTRDGIARSREICDAVAEGESTLDQYLDDFEQLKYETLACERNDPRFQVEIPLSEIIPEWSDPSIYWDAVKAKELALKAKRDAAKARLARKEEAMAKKLKR